MLRLPSRRRTTAWHPTACATPAQRASARSLSRAALWPWPTATRTTWSRQTNGPPLPWRAPQALLGIVGPPIRGTCVPCVSLRPAAPPHLHLQLHRAATHHNGERTRVSCPLRADTSQTGEGRQPRPPVDDCPAGSAQPGPGPGPPHWSSRGDPINLDWTSCPARMQRKLSLQRRTKSSTT